MISSLHLYPSVSTLRSTMCKGIKRSVFPIRSVNLPIHELLSDSIHPVKCHRRLQSEVVVITVQLDGLWSAGVNFAGPFKSAQRFPTINTSTNGPKHSRNEVFEPFTHWSRV